MVTVADNGVGMPPSVLEKIFDPFFTTKEPGKGSGLGLSTAYRIVKDHGGFITVDSREGAGTTFKVYLPVKECKEDRSAPVEDDNLAGGKGKVVLIVDDEAAIREATKSVLETHGYKVMEAEDGVKAVVLFSEHQDEIDVVLMDMMMPLMDGRSTIKAMRALNPDVKIIVSTGVKKYTENNLLKDVEGVLIKPYSITTLLKTLSEAAQ